MALRIQGSVSVDAPRGDVYDLLLDPDMLKRVMNKIPGVTVERLDKTSDTEYSAAATIGVAMVKGTYEGKITILDRRPGEYIKMRGDGKGGGNFTSGTAELTLEQQGEQTLMNYLGQGNISGPLASVGQRLADTVGRQMVDQGAQAFAQEIAAQRREKVGLPPAPPPPRRAPAFPGWAIPAGLVAVAVIAAAIYLLANR